MTKRRMNERNIFEEELRQLCITHSSNENEMLKLAGN